MNKKEKFVFRIHGLIKGYDPDSLIIECETLDDIKIQAKSEATKRGWTNCWSEKLRS